MKLVDNAKYKYCHETDKHVIPFPILPKRD